MPDAPGPRSRRAGRPRLGAADKQVAGEAGTFRVLAQVMAVGSGMPSC